MEMPRGFNATVWAQERTLDGFYEVTVEVYGGKIVATDVIGPDTDSHAALGYLCDELERSSLQNVKP